MKDIQNENGILNERLQDLIKELDGYRTHNENWGN
jgi:hypothetical protein